MGYAGYDYLWILDTQDFGDTGYKQLWVREHRTWDTPSITKSGVRDTVLTHKVVLTWVEGTQDLGYTGFN